MIKDVEELSPELHVHSVALKRDLFEGAHIPGEHARPPEYPLP
jgi:hypothetical protein